MNLLIAGTGKIGTLIAVLLAQTHNYHVHIIDIISQSNNLNNGSSLPPSLQQDVLNVNNITELTSYIKNHDIHAVISCLPYFCNETLARVAAWNQLHYFDLTEDIAVFDIIKQLSSNSRTAFVPQCGVAPGFVNIVCNDLIKKFSPAKAAFLRVGALPAFPHNAFKYALTWSTDGLINEYGNPCYSIKDYKEVITNPLEELETILIDGVEYEAFNTSGGVGNLTSAYAGKIETMNYKTLRYPGHCEKMRLLMNDLQLNKDRENLKHILEEALPKTNQDVVIIYVAVEGNQNGKYMEETYVKKIYPQTISNHQWSAIQIATATSACAVVDIILQDKNHPVGLILQESISLDAFLQNRFAQYYL